MAAHPLPCQLQARASHEVKAARCAPDVGVEGALGLAHGAARGLAPHAHIPVAVPRPHLPVRILRGKTGCGVQGGVSFRTHSAPASLPRDTLNTPHAGSVRPPPARRAAAPKTQFHSDSRVLSKQT